MQYAMAVRTQHYEILGSCNVSFGVAKAQRFCVMSFDVTIT
jgi:hypothetical protein